MKIIVLILSVVSPALATASFYENCLLIGQVKQVELPSTDLPQASELIFVATNSYTLSNSHRDCQYWHNREIDISSEIKSANISPDQKIALHYTHKSSLCEGGQSCGSTQIKIATYR